MITRIITGDARTALADIPDGSIQCCVTSPPYFNLRDYGTATWEGGDAGCDHAKETRHQAQGATSQRVGRSNVESQRNENFRDVCGKCGAVRVDRQIGLEPTLAAYVANLVTVFREVRRVLRDDGTLWLNLGDSYASAWPCNRRNVVGAGSLEDGNRANRPPRMPDGLKEKDLMMVPARVALALQDDGWYLRSDIIWHKTAPMPESVTDRPTSAHEHIFLLTKAPRYYYDADAVREPLKLSSVARLSQNVDAQEGSVRANGGAKTNGAMKAVGTLTGNPRQNPDRRASEGVEGVTDKQRGHVRRHAGFNDRWDAMPREEQQACGANLRNVWSVGPDGFRGAHFAVMPRAIAERCVKAGSREGDTVLDPFSGAGTTLLVADRLGRHAIGCEINPEYVALSESRIRDDAPLFAGVTS